MRRISSNLLSKIGVAMCAMLLCSVSVSKAQADVKLAQIEEDLTSFESLKLVYKKNAPAVVKVFASKLDDEGKAFVIIGSGFFIDSQGFVLSNASTVYNADKIWVDSAGVPFEAKLVGFDPLTNVSVLKVEGNGASFPAVNLETSPKLPEIADALLMLSCELGQEVSPNMGLITGHNITFGDKILPTVYLRTSIPIYGGSVGAPVFSLTGEFKGMSVAALPEIGGSFVLPARAVNRVKDDILLAKKVAYGWFGLVSREISDSKNGVRVIIDAVAPDSPASKAGFEVGDVLLKINGRAITSDKVLRWETFFIRAGELANFKVLRDGKELNLELQVARLNGEVVKAQVVQLEVSLKKNLKKAD